MDKFVALCYYHETYAILMFVFEGPSSGMLHVIFPVRRSSKW